uniref:Uncharacterized protein n=1 Tax=Dolomedes mizhoanus TaxID=1366394 RepID=S5MYJ8_9ARAC|nr:hypothetical protein [Dolomedes mizhoanus]
MKISRRNIVHLFFHCEASPISRALRFHLGRCTIGFLSKTNKNCPSS